MIDKVYCYTITRTKSIDGIINKVQIYEQVLTVVEENKVELLTSIGTDVIKKDLNTVNFNALFCMSYYDKPSFEQYKQEIINHYLRKIVDIRQQNNKRIDNLNKQINFIKATKQKEIK